MTQNNDSNNLAISKSSPISVAVICDPAATLPNYETAGSAGLDVRAFLSEPLTIQPGQTLLIPTGLKIAIPCGYEIQVRPRSGLALKNQVIPLNTPGTIDSDYRGEVKVILANLGKGSFTIEPGMRIAQLVLARYERLVWQSVKNLDETARGQNGFGGTGLH
jgi:dUTP pyrophosphatase